SKVSIASLFALLFSLLTPPVVANVGLVPSPPSVAAKSYLLMDYHSGRLLTAHEIDTRIEPASLTKLMTAYVVLSELKNGTIQLDDEVLISENAWRMKGSRMFLKVKSRVSVDDLLMGMIVQSGNDASVALAEHAAGSEETFAQLMNQYAARLNMTNTHFMNSTGWPQENHYTTARDLATLSQAIIHDFPEHYSRYKIKEYRHNNITQPNRNRLLWLDDRVDGIKTGHTEAAGYCLITSAQQDDMRLISVVVGSSSENARARASRTLLNYGFRFYETFKLHEAMSPLTEMRIWKGAKDSLPLGLAEDLYITAPRGQRGKITAQMSLEPDITAPANKGQRFGHVEIKLGETVLSKQDLIALEGIEAGNLWQRLSDNIILMFQ
ncbi:MAG: D-alanyl-D-alanine carboxypeptidase family protein, partial [Gammaproteobacteria bacterium]